MRTEQGFTEVRILKAQGAAAVAAQDTLAVEEPLEIRLGFVENNRRAHRAVSITMRTPGSDFELAAGFLFTENIITHSDEIETIKHCGTLATGKGFQNTVRVDLRSDVDVDFKRLERHFYTSSSCGVCGKSSIAALHSGVKRINTANVSVFDADAIHRLPEILRRAQSVFERTGGLHAAALFDAAGNIIQVREDVGRHNAVDKLIGGEFLAGRMPLSDKLLFVSGRASFELVQKALMAGICVMAAVGAPSSLAVELAAEFGMTLVGFVRDNRFNIYTHPARINCTAPAISTDNKAAQPSSKAIITARDLTL